MPRTPVYALVFLSATLAGCANLGKTIEKRVDVAETCREAMADPLPDSASPKFHIASIRLGVVGSCELGQNDGIVALCSYDQIWKKYQGAKITPLAAGTEPRVPIEMVRDEWRGFEEKFKILKDNIRSLDDVRIRKVPDFAKLGPEQRALELRTGFGTVKATLQTVSTDIDNLRASLTALRAALVKAEAQLGEQANIELAAWDSNVRVLLDKLEQVLSGDASLVISETLKNQVIRHVAKRSLDLLHSSLKPADAVINKLDEKAYGLISVGYVALQPSLQDAINTTYDDLKKVYEKRNPSQSTDSNHAHMRVFLVELRRAACENLVEGTKFSMLTELVDTMLITKVKGDNNLVLIEDKSPAIPATPASRELLFEMSSMYAAMADGGAVTQMPPEPLDPTPASVYATNEWAARQQLLVQAILAQRKAMGAGAAAKFPGITTVDEADVRNLADAATAKGIDDAARLDPKMLALSPQSGVISNAISNNVNVITAATAVSQANATLTANLSNNNVNTFNPTNTNAPVINIPPYPSAASPQNVAPSDSLCLAKEFQGFGAHCMMDGRDYVIVFNSASGYANDACEGATIERNLTGVAGIVREYGERHRIRFDSSVAGFASMKRTTLKQCQSARQARDVVCTYRNMAREGIEVQGCANAKGDENLLLSAVRAKHAARTLEQATGGGLLVRRLAAGGAQSHDGLLGPYDPAAEQTVVLRFRPLQ